MAERKAVIKNADMSEDMQQDAVECATQVCLNGFWKIPFIYRLQNLALPYN